MGETGEFLICLIPCSVSVSNQTPLLLLLSYLRLRRGKKKLAGVLTLRLQTSEMSKIEAGSWNEREHADMHVYIHTHKTHIHTHTHTHTHAHTRTNTDACTSIYFDTHV